MEITQLRYFLAVAESGSFVQAAEKCFVSQSALSTQVQKLENEVGKQLLNRGHHNVSPTDAGKIVIRHARRILTESERTKHEILSLDAIDGRVTIGILPTIAPYFLPFALKAFCERCPKSYVNVYEETTAQLLHQIEANKLDFGILALPIKEFGFSTEKLFSEELVLAVPKGHELAKKPEVEISDLYSEKFILMQEGHCLGGQSLAFCHKRNFRPKVVIQCGQLLTLQSMVAEGMGVSLVPQMATAFAPPQVVYRHLKRPQPKRTIAIITRSKRPLKQAALECLKSLRRAGTKFEELLKEQARKSWTASST